MHSVNIYSLGIYKAHRNPSTPWVKVNRAPLGIGLILSTYTPLSMDSPPPLRPDVKFCKNVPESLRVDLGLQSTGYGTSVP